MARVIRGRSPFPYPHPAGASTKNIGARRYGAQSAPIEAYSQLTTPIPINGAQGFATINAQGNAQVSVGPSGLGTVWYPAASVLFTALGAADAASANVYIGPSNLPNTLQGGPIFTGNGVLALAIPAMSPGLSIIAVWTGGKPGTVVSMNIVGTMIALTRGQ